MLAAMSMECLLKGVLFCRLKYSPSRTDVSAVAQGVHKLSKLAERVGWRISKVDHLVLENLSHYVRWSGRYPLPRTSIELADSCLNGLGKDEVWAGYLSLREKYGPRVSSSLKQWTRRQQRAPSNHSVQPTTANGRR